MYIRPYGPECITFSFVIAAAAAMETADVAVGAANAAATAVGATDITAAAAVAAGSADIAATAVVAAAATAVAAGTADTGVAAAGIAAGVGDKIREQDPGDFRTRIVTGIAGHMISSKKKNVMEDTFHDILCRLFLLCYSQLPNSAAGSTRSVSVFPIIRSGLTTASCQSVTAPLTGGTG